MDRLISVFELGAEFFSIVDIKTLVMSVMLCALLSESLTWF